MNISRIVKTELLKLPRTGNYILLSILLLADIGLSIVAFFQFSLSNGGNDKAFSSFFDLGEQLLAAQTYVAGLFISIFIIMSIGKEYKDGTLRKNIIDGYTRDDFFIGKLILLVLCVLLVVIIGILSLLIGGLVLEHFDDFMAMLSFPFLVNLFFELFYTALFSMFLIYLFRKTTLGIVFYFVWSIIEEIILGAQKAYVYSKKVEPLVEFGKILPKESLNYVLDTSGIIEPQAVMVTSFYILLMLILPYYLFTKVDIKS